MAVGRAGAIESIMLFWVVAALLTLVASLAVLVPLASRRDLVPNAGAHDVEVYKDQLSEIDRDADRGLIDPAEAEQARTEIARRVIAAGGRRAGSAGQSRQSAMTRLVSAFAVVIVPVLSWSIYSAIGSPDLPSQPLSGRLVQNPEQNSVEELVARAEAHLVANPDDGRGWDVLAPIYYRLGRYAEASNAFRNAIRLEGATAEREAGLGEVLTAEAGGLVTADAQAAFQRASAITPEDPRSRLFLALARLQDGDALGARDAFSALAQSLPADSPWRSAALDAVKEAEARMAAATNPGPSDADVDAAAGMSDTDRAAMIETMVASLDEKLRANPADPEGWARLVRSYVVLGKPEAAKEALGRGLAALGDGSAEAIGLQEFAAGLGLKAVEE